MADTPERVTASGAARLDDTSATIGLCGDCEFARRIESSRGSVFWQCERSRTEPRYRKYPHLPVTQCAGHRRASTTS